MKNKQLFLMLCLLPSVLLTACHRTNPLLTNRDALDDTREYLFFDRGNHFPRSCIDYYKNSNTPASLKTTCDKATQDLFNSMETKGDAKGATVEDVRDPALWQALEKFNQSP